MNNQYEIRGDIVAIFLRRKSGGHLEGIIDLADLPLAQIDGRWCALWEPTAQTFYVYSWEYRMLHRRLLGVTSPLIQVDHWDHNGLNNRRSNLREVSRSINGHNRRVKPANIYKMGSRWGVVIMKDRKVIRGGWFSSQEEAIAAASKLRQEIIPVKYL